MKRTLVLGLLLATLVVWGVTQAFGIAQFYTQPCTTTAAVGSRFTILINLRNNADTVGGWQYLFRWKSALLRCDTIAKGPWLSRNGQYITDLLVDTSSGNRRGDSTALIAECLRNPTTDPGATEDGTMARIVFYVKAAGTCSLWFDNRGRDCYMLKMDATEIPVTLKNGYFQNSSGVEEQRSQVVKSPEMSWCTARPNPFTAYTSVPGYEEERFALYDVSGKQVGIYRGDRIGEGVAPGVYFLRSLDLHAPPLRIVKVR